MSQPQRHRPGSRWRVGWGNPTDEPNVWGTIECLGDHTSIRLPDLTHAVAGPTAFDELVVDQWFHLEQMDKDRWWLGLRREDGSSISMFIWIGDTGSATDIAIENISATEG